MCPILCVPFPVLVIQSVHMMYGRLFKRASQRFWSEVAWTCSLRKGHCRKTLMGVLAMRMYACVLGDRLSVLSHLTTDGSGMGRQHRVLFGSKFPKYKVRQQVANKLLMLQLRKVWLLTTWSHTHLNNFLLLMRVDTHIYSLHTRVQDLINHLVYVCIRQPSKWFHLYVLPISIFISKYPQNTLSR